MTKSNTMINDLTQGPLASKLIRFSLPFMLGNLLQTLYTIVDLAVVGQFVGSTGLSAVSISGQITILMYSAGVGLGNGGQIFIAQQVGAKDYDGIQRSVGTLLTFCGICSIIIAAIGIIFCKPILNLLNTPAEAMEQAVSYFVICCIGIPFTYGYGSLSCILKGMGDSTRPMLFIAIAALTNVVLDLFFVVVIPLESAGAAIATVISQIISFVFAFVYLYKRREAFGFDFRIKSFAIHKKTLGIIAKLSTPLIFMSVSINVSMLYINSYINDYGLVASSVAGVGSKLYSLMNIVTGATQSAVASCVGQNMGAGKMDRVKKSVFIAIGLCLAFFAVVGTLCLVCPKALFGIFSSDPEVLDMAVDYMFVSFWLYLAFSLMAPPLGFLNGIGFTSMNMVVAILDGVVARIGLSLLMGITLNMGLPGFWWGNALAGYISVIIPGIYFLSGKWKTRKLISANI